MKPLDLKEFIWLRKSDKRYYLILAITEYKGDDVVVYRDAQNVGLFEIRSVSDFCKEFDATYTIC